MLRGIGLTQAFAKRRSRRETQIGSITAWSPPGLAPEVPHAPAAARIARICESERELKTTTRAAAQAKATAPIRIKLIILGRGSTSPSTRGVGVAHSPMGD